MEIDTNVFLDNTMRNATLNSIDAEKNNNIQKTSAEKNNVYYDESALEDSLAKDFSYQIKERGEKYYYDGNIQNVYKTKNKYFAKVSGNTSKPYDVEIVVIDEDTAHYRCTCPCTYPCKHLYAVIIAISNLEYDEVELKSPIKEKEINLKSIIKEIPAEEIKNYLLSPIGLNNVAIEMGAFGEYFRKYYPKQNYEYYYNNLYNELIVDGSYIEKINLYIDRARQYLSSDEFDEAFKIVKSIIEAYKDSNRLNTDNYVFDVINKLGIILRITNRKAKLETRIEIKNWSDFLEHEMYYNNYYLEDLILSLK